jgi:hypothetical protein
MNNIPDLTEMSQWQLLWIAAKVSFALTGVLVVVAALLNGLADIVKGFDK